MLCSIYLFIFSFIFVWTDVVTHNEVESIQQETEVAQIVSEEELAPRKRKKASKEDGEGRKRKGSKTAGKENKKAEGSHIAKLKESRGSSHVQMKEDSLESDILGSWESRKVFFFWIYSISR